MAAAGISKRTNREEGVMWLHRLSRWRHRLSLSIDYSTAFSARPLSSLRAAAQSVRSPNIEGRPGITSFRVIDNRHALLLPRYSSLSPVLFPLENKWLVNLSQVRYVSSSSSGRDSNSNNSGHDYTQIGGPIDRSICDLSETEINNLIAARIQCKRSREFQRADMIFDELKQSGVHINDRNREWRADGKSYFPRELSSNAKKDYSKIPNMRDCQTIEEAIQVNYDNLDKLSPRNLSAFWAAVPRFLKPRRGGQQQQSQQMIPQLEAIFNKTAEKLGKFGPRDLATIALAFAKIVNTLEEKTKRSHVRGSYHELLNKVLVDRREIIFQLIANTSRTGLSKFDAQGLSNLAYAYALIEYAPKLDDGSILFDHIAERSIPLSRKFKPQELANTIWAFEKVQASNLPLFEAVANHIVGLKQLDDFIPQNFSNIVLVYAKADISHPSLFEKVANHIVALNNLKDFAPQALANTVWSFEKAGVSHPCLFEKVANHVVALDQLIGFKPQELANIVLAYAKAGVSHPLLFENVADHIVALDNLGAFDPQALSNIVLAYAKAEASHPSLFEKVANHIVALDHLNDFNSQALTNTVWAFGKAGVFHPALFDKVASHILSLDNLQSFNSKACSQILWGYGTADIINHPLFLKVAKHAMTLDYKSLDENDQLSLLRAFQKAEKASKKPQPESKVREVEKKIQELEAKTALKADKEREADRRNDVE